MSLSANKDTRVKQSPARLSLKAVNGLLHIYKGAILAYENGNIGYAMNCAGDVVAYQEFAGIADDELNVAAADNVSDGTFSIKVIPRGSGELVEMDVRSSITIANEGDPVYMDGDDYVDIASGIAHTVTVGLVGIIRQFISTNKAWIQLVQHPIL